MNVKVSTSSWLFSIELPRLILVEDYHDLDIVRRITKTLGLDVKVQEIGMTGDCAEFVGIVYKGRFPSKKTICKLAEKQKIKLDTSSDEIDKGDNTTYMDG